MKQRFSYDFHIHSCLSPCADNDMTPGNIAGMASLAELRIVALTDHNTCRNCPGGGTLRLDCCCGHGADHSGGYPHGLSL